MNCEEFEAMGLGLEGEGAACSEAEAALRASAREHANRCARCAALQESWREARASLRGLRDATQGETPARVEMRLRQEFRTRHRTLKTRGRLVFAAWTLATVAVLLGVVSWWSWHATRIQNIAKNRGAQTPISAAANGGPAANSTDAATLLADNEGDFTLLPGSLPQETQDGAIFRVRLQRGALGALGLPVNEERATDWVQVDLLVGEDGQPRAVRLPSETDN